ncbi:hypothetical protein [Nonomuraea helvata]|uniref:Uncharacterized protein n=1 Tax=Nonomuraea helvata TaxID=37484 RepID=A0ABV5RUB8_9ACTN
MVLEVVPGDEHVVRRQSDIAEEPRPVQVGQDSGALDAVTVWIVKSSRSMGHSASALGMQSQHVGGASASMVVTDAVGELSALVPVRRVCHDGAC